MGERFRLRGRLSADDRALLDRLVVEVGPRLLAYVRHAGNPGDAEDIVAETFCRAARNVTALKSSARPDLYLLTVARNLRRDRFRRRQAEPVAPERLQRILDDGPGPTASLVRREQLDALRGAVADLPDAVREVVVLRLSAGLTFGEIAALLHIPLGTALSRMHAAVQRLRERFGCVHEH